MRHHRLVNRLTASLLFFLGCATAQAQTTVPEVTAPPPPPSPGTTPAPPDSDAGRINIRVDPDAYSIISGVRGLTTHKQTYFYPASYSDDFHGSHTEMVFQISAKWRVFGSDAYLAYSQKSFWQWINGSESSPFRETNYDPEAFYRWIPDPKRFNHWAMDFGFEHESNGQSYTPPDPATGLATNKSRSWNRLYVAPFQAKGAYLAYLKFWYRIPEGDPSSPTNQSGDDNPDITDYLGYGEVDFSRQLGGDQLLSGMIRGNARTGRGAVQLTWSIPSKERWVFWGVSVFHGYGESLILYNEEITRVMVGVLLAR
jgi:phospholipase A1